MIATPAKSSRRVGSQTRSGVAGSSIGALSRCCAPPSSGELWTVDAGVRSGTRRRRAPGGAHRKCAPRLSGLRNKGCRGGRSGSDSDGSTSSGGGIGEVVGAFKNAPPTEGGANSCSKSTYARAPVRMSCP